MTRFTVLAAGSALLAVSVPAASALAANARQPYSNIDRRVDAGNDTGDSQVEALNQQQLNRGGVPGPVGGARAGRGPAGGPVYSYLPPVGYAPPPVVYAPPPAVLVAPYPVYRYYRPYRYYYPY